MKLKTYQAWTMAEALAFVKKDLGADAVILHTRTFERGGFLGFGRRAVVEITAARAADMPASQPAVAPAAAASARSARPMARGNALRTASTDATDGTDTVRFSAAARAYGAPAAAAAMPAASAAAASDRIDMGVEREKTRRLAAAMAIQLEKQAAERSAATRNEDATRERFAAMSASAPSPAVSAAAAHSTPGAPAPVSAPAGSATAQRFVLVPEPAPRGSGVASFTAATVKAGAVHEARGTDERTALLGPARVEARPVQSTSRPAEPARAPVAPWPRVGEAAAAAPVAVEAACPAVERAPHAARASDQGRELDAISAFVGRVLEGREVEPRDAAPSASRTRAAGQSPSTRPEVRAGVGSEARSEALDSTYARLIEQEVAETLARRIMNEVAVELQSARDAGAEPSDAAVREATERRIAALLPADDSDAYRILPGRHGARRIAFVGPTGVGKTTTLAKVAAQLRLKRNLRVGIVAADTYRIAAVDQLRTYADILGLPLEVAASPADAARACERLGDVDVILIDTAGRSQNDRMKLSELRAFLASAAPDETHLVLSATASAKTLAREAEAFGSLGVDRIALTKLDEAAAFGTLVSLVEKLGTRVSFLTHGQEVPDHIELGRSRRLAALVMGSEVR